MTQSIVDTAAAQGDGKEGASAAGATLVPHDEVEFPASDLARLSQSGRRAVEHRAPHELSERGGSTRGARIHEPPQALDVGFRMVVGHRAHAS